MDSFSFHSEWFNFHIQAKMEHWNVNKPKKWSSEIERAKHRKKKMKSPLDISFHRIRNGTHPTVQFTWQRLSKQM